MEDILIYIILALLAIQFIMILVVGFSYRFRNQTEDHAINSVSIVIPFRNESDKLRALCTELKELKVPNGFEIEFILVNDHSSDDSVEIIKNSGLDCKLLDADQRGKKWAIDKGVSHCQNEYVLSMDADISIPRQYLHALSKLRAADMWILPVEMKGTNFLSKLASIDFTWLQMLTHFWASNKNPQLCNGANLLFRKRSYEKVKSKRDDFEIASGDDVFLMRAIHESGGEIYSSSDKNLQVSTQAHQDFNAIISQRQRWGNKMKGKMSFTLLINFSLLILSMSSLFLAFIAYGIYEDPIFIALATSKVIIEWLFLALYKGSRNVIIDVLLVFVHQYFFPVYLAAIMFSTYQPNQKWNLEEQ